VITGYVFLQLAHHLSQALSLSASRESDSTDCLPSIGLFKVPALYLRLGIIFECPSVFLGFANICQAAPMRQSAQNPDARDSVLASIWKKELPSAMTSICHYRVWL